MATTGGACVQAMVMLLFGCANMNTLHLPNCQRLVSRIRSWLASHTGKLSTAQSLSNAAWSLACLDMLDKQLLRKVNTPCSNPSTPNCPSCRFRDHSLQWADQLGHALPPLALDG